MVRFRDAQSSRNAGTREGEFDPRCRKGDSEPHPTTLKIVQNPSRTAQTQRSSAHWLQRLTLLMCRSPHFPDRTQAHLCTKSVYPACTTRTSSRQGRHEALGLEVGGFDGVAVIEYEADPEDPVPALKNSRRHCL